MTKNSGFNLDGHFSTWIFLPAEKSGVFLAWYQCFSTGLFIRSFCTTDLSRGNWRKLLKQSCRTEKMGEIFLPRFKLLPFQFEHQMTPLFFSPGVVDLA